jgi:hypothetical protein
MRDEFYIVNDIDGLWFSLNGIVYGLMPNDNKGNDPMRVVDPYEAYNIDDRELITALEGNDPSPYVNKWGWIIGDYHIEYTIDNWIVTKISSK